MRRHSQQAFPPLTPALPGERREFEGRAGRLSCYVAGQGAPLLLVHSINAAGSAYEVKPVYEWAVTRRRVYALDLPGYGFSDRSPRDYGVPLFVDALRDALEFIEREAGPAPVDAMALSLSSEFLARLAVQRAGRLRSLTLVTPTGFSRRSGHIAKREGTTREVPGLRAILSAPLWSQGLYGLLVSRASVAYFMRRTFGSDAVEEALIDYAWLTSHQPDARHAPLAFLSGRLFSADIRAVYERLTVPVWVPHATRGDFKDFSAAGWTSSRPNWRLQPFPTGAMPYFEQPAAFLEAFGRFLEAQG